MTFTATEMDLSTGAATGRTEVFTATNLTQAMESARYTHALAGPAEVGPSGRTLFFGTNKALVFPRKTKS